MTEKMQHIYYVEPQAGLTHTGNSTKLSVTGKWTAPSPGTGPIRFRQVQYYNILYLRHCMQGSCIVICVWLCRFAVVQSSSIYWADVMSGVVYESGEVTDVTKRQYTVGQ